MRWENDVHRLRRLGLSIRAIAEELGLSRSKVHRAVTVPSRDDDGGGDDWDDGDDATLFNSDDDDDPGLVEPIVFVGWERVWCAGAGGDLGRWALEERYIDGASQPCSTLDLYRWLQYMTHDHDDRERANRIRADLARQIEAVKGEG